MTPGSGDEYAVERIRLRQRELNGHCGNLGINRQNPKM